MRICRYAACFLLALSASALAADPPQAQPPQAPAHHVVVAADAIQWKSLRPGAEIAAVSGDPNAEGSPFVLRLRYRGKARIYLDNVLVATVSFRSTSTLSRRFVYSRYIPAGGAHTIKVVPTGTGTYPVIRVDAIVVGR